MAYGIEFSRKFLDVREQVDDLQSKINVHNNNAGRSVSLALTSICDPILAIKLFRLTNVHSSKKERGKTVQKLK